MSINNNDITWSKLDRLFFSLFRLLVVHWNSERFELFESFNAFDDEIIVNSLWMIKIIFSIDVFDFLFLLFFTELKLFGIRSSSFVAEKRLVKVR